MTDYRILAFAADDGPRAGIAISDAIFDVADSTSIAAWRSTDAIFADWQRAKGRLAALVDSGDGKPAKLRAGAAAVAPLRHPGAIFCAGANYKDHVLEMARAQNIAPEPDPHVVGLKSWHFIKLATCIAAPDETIMLPRHSRKVDWEAELALVIGKTAKDVPVESALDYVAGYLVANDLSARDLGKRPNVPDQSPFQQDWVAHKCFDQSCPLGPWVVPADQIRDPQNLGIQSWVNGVLKQDSNTSAMIFTIAEQIAHLSEKLTLHPGDVILTGTPAGVGTSRGEFLKPGDVVRIRVEGVGEITNTMA